MREPSTHTISYYLRQILRQTRVRKERTRHRTERLATAPLILNAGTATGEWTVMSSASAGAARRSSPKLHYSGVEGAVSRTALHVPAVMGQKCKGEAAAPRSSVSMLFSPE